MLLPTSLCFPGPALADTLGPDPLSLCGGHHLGAASAVAPYPGVHLTEPAAVAPVSLRVGGGASNFQLKGANRPSRCVELSGDCCSR